MKKVVDIRFKPAGRLYHFSSGDIELKIGDIAIVEVEKGIGIGKVVLAPRVVDEAGLEHKLKKVVRKADPVDMERDQFNREREQEAFRICKEKIARYRLHMKLVEVEYLFDSSKAIFYFTSESRVDFRELVKDLAACFYTRIEMRQIGVRDEAKHVGGLGPCGRELCCSSFLQDFAPVTVKMAKEQNIALNPLKISGVCGRLMCCLGYEVGAGACPKKGGGRDRGKPRDKAQVAAEGEKQDQGQDRGRSRDRGRGRERRDGQADRPGRAEGKSAEASQAKTGAEVDGEGRTSCCRSQRQDQGQGQEGQGHSEPQGDANKTLQASDQPHSRDDKDKNRPARRGRSRGRGRSRRRGKGEKQGQLENKARGQITDGSGRSVDKAIVAAEPSLPVSKPPAPLSLRKENNDEGPI